MFLRFSPEEESTPGKIAAELEFLRYLRTNDYPAVDTVPSKSGAEMETIDTPWGRYSAVVFKGVPGICAGDLALTDEIIHDYGRSLGDLHQLSRRFIPVESKRDTYQDRFGWMENVLRQFPGETKARTEVEILHGFFQGLPGGTMNFGLIHYDFERDNLFYDAGNRKFHVIDFDDAVYHWFVMDLVQALDSITEDMCEGEKAVAEKSFLTGYRSVMPLEEDIWNLAPAFRRYARLYGYVRILRAMAEKWNHEPEWMQGLRKHLRLSLENRGREFGTPVHSG